MANTQKIQAVIEVNQKEALNSIKKMEAEL